jgi:hypothetical protein
MYELHVRHKLTSYTNTLGNYDHRRTDDLPLLVDSGEPVVESEWQVEWAESERLF